MLSLFFMLIAQPSFAQKAVIRFGNSPMYGQEMRLTPGNHASKPITELEEFGAGEDEEFVLSCYEGSLEDVCALAKAAMDDENARQHYRGTNLLRLTSCNFGDPNFYYPKSILVRIESKKEGRFRFPQLTPCNRRR